MVKSKDGSHITVDLIDFRSKNAFRILHCNIKSLRLKADVIKLDLLQSHLAVLTLSGTCFF